MILLQNRSLNSLHQQQQTSQKMITVWTTTTSMALKMSPLSKQRLLSKQRQQQQQHNHLQKSKPKHQHQRQRIMTTIITKTMKTTRMTTTNLLLLHQPKINQLQMQLRSHFLQLLQHYKLASSVHHGLLPLNKLLKRSRASEWPSLPSNAATPRRSASPRRKPHWCLLWCMVDLATSPGPALITDYLSTKILAKKKRRFELALANRIHPDGNLTWRSLTLWT
mmetsp:Transcript_17979/g.35142  ORF Transcript_17979/g.35142 Transcript_17979/m.35142 type:complete len:222 (+) Transcript_17979:284-949(+)